MFDLDVLGPMASGAVTTIQLTLIAAALGTSLSVLSGLAGLSRWSAVRAVNRVYIDFFRGTSAIVQLYWFFFALPLAGVSVSPFMSGVIVLGVNMGSYGSEVVRGSIVAVPKGQYEASTALGLTSLQRMRYVIFPQAVRIMLPTYGNLLIELLKATALVSLITLSDILFEVQKLRTNRTADTTTLYNTALVMYFVIALGFTGFVRGLERYFGRSEARHPVRRPLVFGRIAGLGRFRR